MTIGLKNAVAASLVGVALFLAQPASATIVRVQTVLGDVDINLFDNATPKTVANFLAYVNANAFASNVVYRSEPGFVVQAGGFRYSGALPLVAVPENPKVANEPVYSNVRGTVAMAKIATDPNSATNQWFINLADNSANLDTQNGGFTVFGQVTSGMAVVDAIAALSRFNMGGNFTAVPLRNYTQADATAGVTVTDNNLVLITNIIVIDSSVNSASGLSPVANTRINAPSGGGDDGGGGGDLGLAGVFALGMLLAARRFLARESRA